MGLTVLLLLIIAGAKENLFATVELQFLLLIKRTHKYKISSPGFTPNGAEEGSRKARGRLEETHHVFVN